MISSFPTYLPRTAVGRAGRGCARCGGSLQSHQGHGRRVAAERMQKRRWRRRRMRDDARLSRTLSPGRKCLVRLPSSTWPRSRTPFRRRSERPLSRPPSCAGVRGGYPKFAPGQWRQKILRFHPWRSRQTKHGAGCERSRNDMQLPETPLIGWPSSRARCHWANVVKVTGQTRNSLMQIKDDITTQFNKGNVLLCPGTAACKFKKRWSSRFTDIFSMICPFFFPFHFSHNPN